MMRTVKASLLILGSFGLASAAMAAPSGGYKTTPYDGSSFTSACVGHNFQGFGFGSGLGLDLSTRSLFNANNDPANCQTSVSSGPGLATSSAADGGPIGNLGGSYNGAASGAATAGVIKLQAANTANDSQRFTGAAANGGWNDNVTVTGGTGQGLWVIPIAISGTVNAQDPGTTAIFEIMPYVNGTAITEPSPAQEGAAVGLYKSINTVANGDILSSAGFEYSAYGVVNHGGGDPLIQFAVNEIVNLVIPMTYGVAFDLGIYASALAGERAQSAADGLGEVLFQNTVTWLGGGYVLAWDSVNGIGAQNDAITITAVSGLNYMQSFAESVPAPGTFILLGIGLIGAGALRRRTA